MKKLYLIAILLTAILAGVAIAAVTFTVIIPTTLQTANVAVSVEWLNGSAVTNIDWGVILNSTPVNLTQLINITNVGNQPATLSLTATNLVNITWINLTWNATSPLAVGASSITQLTMNVTTSAPSSSYDTKIDAT